MMPSGLSRERETEEDNVLVARYSRIGAVALVVRELGAPAPVPRPLMAQVHGVIAVVVGAREGGVVGQVLERRIRAGGEQRRDVISRAEDAAAAGLIDGADFGERDRAVIVLAPVRRDGE